MHKLVNPNLINLIRMWGIVLALLVPAIVSQGANAAEDLQRQVNLQAQPLIDAQIADGFVIGLVDGDKTYVYSYGSVASGIGGVPANKTVFEIGSMTKVFTGILLADMVERKMVNLEDPVAKYLPAAVTLPKSGERQITLLDLATQSSGLPRMPDNLTPKDPANPFADYSVEQLYGFLSKTKLTREPGSKYEYSNLGMGLLGHALALKANSTYEDVVTNWICKPLGMNDTRITLTPDQKTRLAPGHNIDGGSEPNWDIPVLAGAGALRSTVSDMLQFLQANLADATKPTTMPGDLGAALTNARISRRPIDGPGSIGLAWHILTGGKVCWHNGQTGGYHSFIAMNHDRHQGVVILCNTACGEVDGVGFNLVKVLAGDTPASLKLKLPIKLGPQILSQYVGRYEFVPNFVLTITMSGDRLMAQASNQPQFRIYPSSVNEFFYRVVNAQITFVKNGNGQVVQLILHQNGRDLPAKRLPSS